MNESIMAIPPALLPPPPPPHPPQSQDRMKSFSFPNSNNESDNDQAVDSSTSNHYTVPYHGLYTRRNSAHAPSTSQIIEEEDPSEGQSSNEPQYSRPRLSLYLREARKMPAFEMSSTNPKSTPDSIQIVKFPSHNRRSSLPKSSPTPILSPTSRRPSASLSPRRTSMASIESRYSLFSPTLSPSSPPSMGLRTPGSSPARHCHAHRRSGSLSGTMITNDLFNNNVSDVPHTPRYHPKSSCPAPPTPITPITPQLDLPFGFDNESSIGSIIGNHSRKSSTTIQPEEEERMALFSFDNKTTVLNSIDTDTPIENGSEDDYEELKSIGSSDTSSTSATLAAEEDTPVHTNRFESNRRRSVIYKISSPTDVVVNLDDIFKATTK